MIVGTKLLNCNLKVSVSNPTHGQKLNRSSASNSIYNLRSIFSLWKPISSYVFNWRVLELISSVDNWISQNSFPLYQQYDLFLFNSFFIIRLLVAIFCWKPSWIKIITVLRRNLSHSGSFVDYSYFFFALGQDCFLILSYWCWRILPMFPDDSLKVILLNFK